jgi:hypothetical protein
MATKALIHTRPKARRIHIAVQGYDPQQGEARVAKVRKATIKSSKCTAPKPKENKSTPVSA